MVKIDIKVDGKDKTIYMDNKLDRQITEKVMPRVLKKDNDWLIVVDGPEGSGKSVLAMQLAKRLDASFDLSRMCMTPEEFTKVIIKAKKGQCVVFDEAFTGLSSRQALSEMNKLLIGLMMEMRQKNLFVIVIMPTIFLLDSYVALFRARGLFHVYLKNGNRGRWIYFNNKKKKILYQTGKKMYSYLKPKSSFRGKFYDQYTLNEKAYRKKKADAFGKKTRETRAATYKAQRDLLLYAIYTKLGKNQTEISKLCKEYGFKLERNTISEIITQVDRLLLVKMNK